MEKVSLSFYELIAYSKRKPTDLQNLDQLDGPEGDIIDAIKKFFDQLPQYNVTQIDVSPLALKNRIYREGSPKLVNRQINGVIRHGENGFSSTFFDGSSGKKSFDRKPNHIELMPFYFLADIPKGKKSGVICFQTFGVHSVSGRINANLQDYLSDLYAQHYTVKLHVIQVGAASAARYIKDGKIKSITATKHFQPSDVASDDTKEVKFKCELSPYKRGAFFRPKFNKALTEYAASNTPNKKAVIHKIGSYLSIDLDEFHDMEVLIDLDGDVRTIDLGDFSKSATRFDVTEKIHRNSTGHPTFASVDTIAKEILSKNIRKLINR